MKHNWLQIFAISSFALISAGFIHFIRATSFIQYHFYAIGIAFGCVYVFYELYWKRRRLPPGPTPLLLAGNMLEVLLNPNIDALFLRWRQRFGGIFTFWMGPIPMVFVAETDIMKRYFVKHADVFSSRWRNFITETLLDGDKWREQRRFSLHVLRDFGVGRDLMEKKIAHQVDVLIDHLSAYAETRTPVDLCEPLAVCVGNIINDVLFGKTFRHDDPEFRTLHEMLDRQSSLVIKPIMGLYLVAPWTTNVPLINGPWLELLSIRDTLWAFLGTQLQEHKRLFNPDADSSDFTYTYLKEMCERKMYGEEMGFFSEKQLSMLLLDLFFAGMETTVTTSKWGFLMLVLHPEVQKKAHDELDRLPNRILLQDRPKLIYVQALINEIQRVANILPINLLRTVAENVEIDGFSFPCGTMVLPQISIAMNDPKNFPQPAQFNPDRFIDENHNLKKYDAFLPFSIGKRQCLGESLAKAELFLIFANLLRNFEFHTIESEAPPTRKRCYGLTVSPTKYKCVVIKRS